MCTNCSHSKQLARCRAYKKKNKEAVQQYNRKYKKTNAQAIKEYNRIYNIENREEIQKRQTWQHRERRKTDMKYKTSVTLNNRLRKFYTGKGSASIRKLVGCTMTDFLRWIEFQFTGNMSWENHGDLWHIDHVLHCSWFDLTTEKDRKVCFHWKNMRPLLAVKNQAKNQQKFDIVDLLFHELVTNVYEKNHQKGYTQLEYKPYQIATKLLEKSDSGHS